jgi:hypothetical protein
MLRQSHLPVRVELNSASESDSIARPTESDGCRTRRAGLPKGADLPMTSLKAPFASYFRATIFLEFIPAGEGVIPWRKLRPFQQSPFLDPDRTENQALNSKKCEDSKKLLEETRGSAISTRVRLPVPFTCLLLGRILVLGLPRRILLLLWILLCRIALLEIVLDRTRTVWIVAGYRSHRIRSSCQIFEKLVPIGL